MAAVPAYHFLCPHGHVTELVQSIHADLPATVACGFTVVGIDAGDEQTQIAVCDGPASRVYQPPAAIIYRGRGFYATDVKGAQQRKRRPNPGDGLRRQHDPEAAAIARSL